MTSPREHFLLSSKTKKYTSQAGILTSTFIKYTAAREVHFASAIKKNVYRYIKMSQNMLTAMVTLHYNYISELLITIARASYVILLQNYTPLSKNIYCRMAILQNT